MAVAAGRTEAVARKNPKVIAEENQTKVGQWCPPSPRVSEPGGVFMLGAQQRGGFDPCRETVNGK